MPLNKADKLKAIELLREKKLRRETNKLQHYTPYPFQKKFMQAGADSRQRLLMAANRVGKSDIGAYEVAVHATGLYPDWWEGVRFEKPPVIWIGGTSNDKVRDIIQAKLTGDPNNPTDYGKGFLPRASILKAVRKPGIPNAYSNLQVSHVSGDNSSISFLSYESGKEAWYGVGVNYILLDEEPPEEIYSQALRGIVDKAGYITMTFTPENGITNIVLQFTKDIQKGQYLQNATWDDAPHIQGEVKEQILAALSPHERDMRSKGIPMMGSGLVYPVAVADITCPPIDIPKHWLRIGGIDFGWDHPTAWVSLAYDPEQDVVYLVNEYRERKKLPDEVTSVIKKKKGNHYPTVWPHDGLNTDKTSGKILKDVYMEEGLEMLPEKFSNPPEPGKMEGTGGNGVEVGIMEVMTRMKTGRVKVFNTCTQWFEEFGMYHRKDGKIVAIHDDLMAATRYAAQSLRHARAADFVFDCFIPTMDSYADLDIGY